ncbi:hypothetical protein HY972_00475 [Candidatus Kaiserbacteria bacterium]|nr:hypothetical protein [Candidatus Kaiserbacteria bacterium]
MLWRQKHRWDSEIAPDEIFLDASNAPAFDRARLEGKIEKPLTPRAFGAFAAALVALFSVLLVRTGNLQITNGAAFAAASAHNSLEATTLFAPRGVILDARGAVLAENAEGEGGGIARVYPFSSVSRVVGYVSYPKKDARGIYYDTKMSGVAGLEAEHDAWLSGENGQLLTETDVFGTVRSEGTIIPAKPGGALRVSIDIGLQEPLARAIAETALDKAFIAGAGVILDVHSGAVRALVSYPSYDSNVLSKGGPAEIIARYNSDPGHPFLDHALQGVYAPGSIVKPLVAVGALTDGLITPATVITDTGFISIPDPYRPGKEFVYKGWKALGPVDVKKAIAWSSDIFFYTIGGGFGNQKGLGIDRLAYWYAQFGLGSPTGIDLAGEARGLIPTPAWKEGTFNERWYLGDTYFTAIGQYSMQVTPLQMARAIAAVANGGRLYTPALVPRETPSFAAVPASPSAFQTVREGMRQAVTSALAATLNVPYVSVAAKTGTAQTGARNQYDNSWVVGFFPYEDPQYAFAVVLERGPEGSGSQAVNVMRLFLDALHAKNSSYVGGTATTTAHSLSL